MNMLRAFVSIQTQKNLYCHEREGLQVGMKLEKKKSIVALLPRIIITIVILKLLIWLYSVSRNVLISQDILYCAIWKNYFLKQQMERTFDIRSEIPHSESVELTDVLTSDALTRSTVIFQMSMLGSMPNCCHACNHSSSERSFSTMKRVKTYLQSTMGQSVESPYDSKHIQRIA